MFITCLGIFDQFSYPDQEFRLKTDTLKNGTSRICLYGSAPPPPPVQEWPEKTNQFNPEEWGWTCRKGKLFPYTISLPATSESPVTVIRCSCKTNCESRRCNCRKQGLDCSIACSESRGVSCSNTGEIKNSEDIFYDICIVGENFQELCFP